MDLQKTVERNREGFGKNPYRLMPENRPEGCPKPREIIRVLGDTFDQFRPKDSPKGSSVLWEVQMVYVCPDGRINLRCREYAPKFEAWARIFDYTAPETSIEIVKTWEHRVAERLMS
jgi:hypothetical protein